MQSPEGSRPPLSQREQVEDGRMPIRPNAKHTKVRGPPQDLQIHQIGVRTPQQLAAMEKLNEQQHNTPGWSNKECQPLSPQPTTASIVPEEAFFSPGLVAERRAQRWADVELTDGPLVIEYSSEPTSGLQQAQRVNQRADKDLLLATHHE
eukprot:c30043_g1_i1 orf=1-447(-)